LVKPWYLLPKNSHKEYFGQALWLYTS
jgi:hypothetical protein